MDVIDGLNCFYTKVANMRLFPSASIWGGGGLRGLQEATGGERRGSGREMEGALKCPIQQFCFTLALILNPSPSFKPGLFHFEA